jgi:amino acid permease
MSTKISFRPLTAVCLLAAVGFVVIGVAYFSQTAASLPSFFPGHQAGSAHHHVKHGIAMIGLAFLAVVGAWFSTAPASRSQKRASSSSQAT